MKNYFLLIFILTITFLINTTVADGTEKDNYSDYIDLRTEESKCVGYDFDPKKVVLISLGSVFLDDGKEFYIMDSLGNCESGDLEGVDGYKQLPEGCSFLVGTVCIAPPPSNCKERLGIYCFKDIYYQKRVLFQWEATNKGWERMTSFREYRESEVN